MVPLCQVSILVLMDSRVKTGWCRLFFTLKEVVSILVLMDSRVKTAWDCFPGYGFVSFNPCFNG